MELKPCPFCGSGVEFDEDESQIQCFKCGFFYNCENGMDADTAKAWNTRAPIPAAAVSEPKPTKAQVMQRLLQDADNDTFASGLSHQDLADHLKELVWAYMRLGDLKMAVVGEAIERLQKLSLNEQPAPAWRPIESAPKDGTEILVAKYTGNALCWASHGAWSKELNKFWDFVEPSGFSTPTHWMPMPPGPYSMPLPAAPDAREEVQGKEEKL